jgi:hypothetical protein
LKVVGEVETDTYGKREAGRLAADVRSMIIGQVAEWRGVDAAELDGARKTAVLS